MGFSRQEYWSGLSCNNNNQHDDGGDVSDDDDMLIPCVKCFPWIFSWEWIDASITSILPMNKLLERNYPHSHN